MKEIADCIILNYKFDTIPHEILKPSGTCWVITPEDIMFDKYAIQMIDEGWILRNKIILYKDLKSSYDVLYFFVKSKKYYFKQQIEPYTTELNRWGGEKVIPKTQSEWDAGTGQKTYRKRSMRPNPLGRNKRCVWTESFEDVIRTIIKAGSPEQVCVNCGEPKEVIKERIVKEGKTKEITGKYKNNDTFAHSVGSRKVYYTTTRRYKIPNSMRVLFAKWLRKYIQGNQTNLDILFGRSKWEHWVRTDTNGQSLPSPEDYKQLKEALSLPNDWDKWLLETVTTLVDNQDNSYKDYEGIIYCSCGSSEWKNSLVLSTDKSIQPIAQELSRDWGWL
jgi:hypothetical protein